MITDKLNDITLPDKIEVLTDEDLEKYESDLKELGMIQFTGNENAVAAAEAAAAEAEAEAEAAAEAAGMDGGARKLTKRNRKRLNKKGKLSKRNRKHKQKGGEEEGKAEQKNQQ